MKKWSHSYGQSGFTISAVQQWGRHVAAKRPRTRSSRIDRSQTGFTIVELMIATLVFSLILLVITYGVLHFTSAYYKGVNSSTTQNKARSIMDTVSQAIQFSGTQVVPTMSNGSTSYFCAGGKIYVYNLGVSYDGTTPTSTMPGLYATPDNGSCIPTASSYSGGTELLGKNMRLTSLQVQQAPGSQIYTVSIRLAYASGGTVNGNDLLCDTTISGSQKGGCAPGAQSYAAGDAVSGNGIVCKLQTGYQFCDVAALSTTVLRRVTGS